MPNALEELKAKVKMVALQIGVREAARRFELSEDRVRQWSKREGWFAQKAEADKVMMDWAEDEGLSPAVTKTPSEAMEGYKGESKLALAHGLTRAARGMERKSEEVLADKHTGGLLNLTSAWAKLHTSEESQTQASPFQLGIQVVVQATPQP